MRRNSKSRKVTEKRLDASLLESLSQRQDELETSIIALANSMKVLAGSTNRNITDIDHLKSQIAVPAIPKEANYYH